jgi:hypothetical protein
LNVNELNSPVKRQSWLNVKNSKAKLYIAYKRFISPLMTHIQWKWRNERYSITKESRVAKLVEDKQTLNHKLKEETKTYYTTTKKFIPQENITIITYVSNIGTSKYINAERCEGRDRY